MLCPTSVVDRQLPTVKVPGELGELVSKSPGPHP
jgi:hypothetical protein